MRRAYITLYSYEVKADDKVFKHTSKRQIDYKRTIANFKAQGYSKVWITFVGKEEYQD